MTMGLVYPLSEHVDIFPVRLVSTFPLSILRLPYSNHLSYVVVFILRNCTHVQLVGNSLRYEDTKTRCLVKKIPQPLRVKSV
jgi:hypothetical protein